MSKTDNKEVTDVVAHEEVKGNSQLLAAESKATPIAMATPADLLQMAVQGGADLDRLERLMALQMQWESNEARKAFVVAMAEFKKNPPTIIKDKRVTFKTSTGVTDYKHAAIGQVVQKIVEGLSEHGFSHRWIPGREGDQVTITCVITHKLGHSEETKLSAGLDTSGGKNNIQAMISTKTYLERHSLLAATGLATMDQEDDDGLGGEQEKAEETIVKRDISAEPFKRMIAAIESGKYEAKMAHVEYNMSEDQKIAVKDAEKVFLKKGKSK